MRYALSLVLVAFIGCAGDAPEGTPMLPDEVTYAPELGVEISAMERTESGIYQQVLVEGSGEPSAVGDSLGVSYTLWLADGRKMDASADHSPPGPLKMKLGETPLIQGWVEAVTGMRLGEKKRVVLPYTLGYGSNGAGGAGGIPPYATLIFEMEIAELTRGS